MAGGSDKEQAKRSARAYRLYGAAWALLTLVYLGARALLAQPLRSAGELVAWLLLQAVLGWAVFASAGAFGVSDKTWKRGGTGLESALDYLALGAAAELLHLWPRLASGWLLLLPPLVFAAHSVYAVRETIGNLLSSFGGAGGAAAAAAGGKGGAAGVGDVGAGGGGGGGGGAGGAGSGDKRSEEAKKKAADKKQRHAEMQMKQMRGVKRGTMPQRRKEGEDE